MIRRILFSIFSFAAFFQMSCNNGLSKVAPISQSDPGLNSPGFSGTFSGTTPCADCPGIKTTVSFKADATFIENMEYLERNTSFSDTGKWHIADKIITVTFSSKSSAPKFYLVKSDSTIAILGADKKEIESPMAKYYILKKIRD